VKKLVPFVMIFMLLGFLPVYATSQDDNSI